MKNIFLIFVLILSSALSVFAQEIVTKSPQLKAVVLEEYTGIKCGFCPQGHAIAAQILAANPSKVSIIAIHEGSYAVPSGSQPDFRTSFGTSLANQTGLEGFPAATVNRHFFDNLSSDGVTALNRGDWSSASNQILLQESYVNVGVKTEFDDVSRMLTVTVEVYYTGNTPFGVNSNFINIAITESNVLGYQANGGSNYNHKHVLRHLITGQWGDEIIAPEYGTLISRTYTYTVPENWNTTNCDVVAFIAESHQEIITGKTVSLKNGLNNGEVTSDYGRLFVENAISIGEPAFESDFSFTIINGRDVDQNFRLDLSHNAPADWVVTFEYNSEVYTETTNITLSANEIVTVQIHITPGVTAGVAKSVLKLKSLDSPALVQKVAEAFLVSGIDNLIVNGSGNGSSISSYPFESFYKNALANAGCETVGAIPGYAFEQAVDIGALDNVRNIYLNIGGTTPVLTLGQVQFLRSYLTNGGNLFIAGQDFARDIMGTGATSSTITHKLFYQNFLSAVYLNDGDAGNNHIKSTITDSIFGFIPASALVDAYDGTFDPDEIKKYSNGNEIFHYPSGKAGGLRAYKGTARIVLLAFGLEQIANIDTRNDIMDRTYRWFEGWVGTGVCNNIHSEISIYPNPSDGLVKISGVPQNSLLNVYSVTGQVVASFSNGPSDFVELSGLKEGSYRLVIQSETDINSYNLIIVK